jgi:hypothetical protein
MASQDLETIQNAVAASSARAQAKVTTLNATTGTLPAGAITGSSDVTLISSNATPGAQACRSAAQMLADIGGVGAPYAYNLRIVNTGANPFTLAADAGATVTLGAGTYTVLLNTFRDFVVSFPTATTCTIATIGIGTWS